METTILIALGSNRRHARLGPPRAVLAAAIAAMPAHGITPLAVSRAYRTEPVGPPQPQYLNAGLLASTGLDVRATMAALLAIEGQLGRKRTRRWAARVIDLDLIGHGDRCYPGRLLWQRGRGLVVPHRHAHSRAFVLVPLAQVAPRWRHPALGRTISQLAARLYPARAVRPAGRLDITLQGVSPTFSAISSTMPTSPEPMRVGT